jgi:ribonuclease HI
MPLDPRAIHIYTDGSCYRNPGGASGCAAIANYPEHLNRQDEVIVDFGCAESSNQRMELLAVIKALRWIRESKPWPGVSRAQVVTDSRYVKDNIPRARGWKENDWCNQFGEPRENWDLWKDFLSAQQKVGMVVTFEWMLGKKSPMLKRIDKAAKAAAARGGSNVDRGFKPGTVARSMVKGSASRFGARGQVAAIRVYRKNFMKGGDNKVRFDLLTDDLTAYLASRYGYVSPELAADLHRGHGYRVLFNSEPRFPRILSIVEEIKLPKNQKG